MVGYLMGDGYVGGKTPVSFINVSAQLQEDAARIAAELGCRATARKSGSRFRSRTVRASVTPYSNCAARTGIWASWLGEDDSCAVIRAGRGGDVVANLLFGLLESDGWWGGSRTVELRVGYATTSEQLAHQIHWLLMRWGISSSVRRRDPRARVGGIILVGGSAVSALAGRSVSPASTTSQLLPTRFRSGAHAARRGRCVQ